MPNAHLGVEIPSVHLDLVAKNKRLRCRYFVGVKPDGSYHVFKHHEIPTEKDFGLAFNATIGPFKTKYGALFMAKYGRNNPNCQSVFDAERLATLTWGPQWKKGRVRVATIGEPDGKKEKPSDRMRRKKGGLMCGLPAPRSPELDAEILYNTKGQVVLAVHPVYDPNELQVGLYTLTHIGTGCSVLSGVTRTTAKKVGRTLFDRLRDHADCSDAETVAGLISHNRELVQWIRRCWSGKYVPHSSSPE